MEAGAQPVRFSPIFSARRGKPLWSLTRLSRSSAHAKTTRPSSRNETVASLSRGLIPRTRIVLFQMVGDFGHGRGPKIGPGGHFPQDLIDPCEHPVAVGLGASEAAAAGQEGRAVNHEIEPSRAG